MKVRKRDERERRHKNQNVRKDTQSSGGREKINQKVDREMDG